MPFPGIFRRLFENKGAGPNLKKEILPPHADTHAPDGSDPLDVASLGGVSSDDFSELKKKVEDLIEGISNIDPWTVFPPRLPVAIDGVTFGGSDGRRAIMPGETEAREDWILCDGGSDGKGGTVPDLRGRMILGASDEHEAGSTGGSETHTHSITGTVGETTLTVGQLASHTHTAPAAAQDAGGGIIAGGSGSSGSTWTLNYTGGSQQHSHALDGMSGEANNLPPHYALAYIMRTV
nr:MAG TPA: Baseplate structural protein [Caudoviricetes sp.]